MNKSGLFGVLVLGFLAGLAGAYVAPNLIPHVATPAAETASAKESTYDRVMRTQTIRCGYAIWPPSIMKDPNSGQLSGIFYDYTQTLGAKLHLKIDWAEEIGWGDLAAALKSGRVDAICSGIWPNSARAREIDFAEPIFFSAIYPYVRIDDTRFDNKVTSLNDPLVTVAIVDGETGALVASTNFPNAKTLELPQLTDTTEVIADVLNKKADVFFADPAFVGKYMKENPGKIRQVGGATPLRVFGNSIAIASDQLQFQHMLDIATDEILASGEIEKTITKYEDVPGSMLRVAPTYIVRPQ